MRRRREGLAVAPVPRRHTYPSLGQRLSPSEKLPFASRTLEIRQARPGYRAGTVACLLVVLWAASVSPAAEDQKPFFLPKSPAAAAYVLRRLSNKELADAPRSEFVYVALLQRNGLERKYRLEALDGLARLRATSALTELIRGIMELERKGAEAEPALRELATLLMQSKPVDLTGQRDSLEKLADDAQTPLGRQIGCAALVTADGSVDSLWRKTETDPARSSDLLLSLPLIRDEALRAGCYPKVEPLLHRTDAPELRRAAITAIPALPGHDADIIRTLMELAKTESDRAAAVASLQRMPREHWPKEQAAPLVESLIDYLRAVPVDQRTTPEAANAFQLATDLAAGLPAEQAAALNRTLRALGVNIVVVRTLKDQMLYDKPLIVVEADKPLEIRLINDDAMPHNLVVAAPGAVQEIGEAAEKMQPTPDGEGRLYIPESPKVLHATRLVEPGQQARLSFNAPEAPAEYPFLCTFPGHWRRMVGLLAVVKDVDAYLASHRNAAAPKMTEWKLEDLAPGLGKAGFGRNLAAGRELFTRLACRQCHKVGAEGYAYGPDLTEVFKRWKGERASVLEQILEPSKVIEDRYRSVNFELKSGEEITGMILKEEADSLLIQTGPADNLIQTLKKSDIQSRRPQKSSVMPVGLLNTLSKEEILDLLAYLESGGKLPAHEHTH